MRSCYPWPYGDIWRAAVVLHHQKASTKVNQTFCFKARWPFLWWKRQEILFQGTGGRHRDANYVIRAILQPIWTKQDADCSGTLEKMGVTGTWFSRKNTKPPVHRGERLAGGATGVQSSHLSKLIQRGAAEYADVFNGQSSQRKTPKQRAGLLQRCWRQEWK